MQLSDQNVQIKEIQECLNTMHYINDLNLNLTSTLHMSISTQVIELDQVLPSRLENYMFVVQSKQNDWSQYIQNLSLIEAQENKVEYTNLKEFAVPIVISLKEEKQYQIINSNSNRQIGLQQKKSDGLLSNQIFNSKIQKTRSTSPQPSIFNTNSQIPPPVTIAESELIFNTANQSSLANPLNDTHQSNYQISKWNDPSQNQKILFQDNLYLEDENKKNQQSKQNVIVVKKSEDPLFFEQLRKARVASPNIVRQVKGSGLSPEPYKTSKSPEPIIQVALPKNSKKFETNTTNQKSQVQQVEQKSSKIQEQFKKLQLDSKNRSNPKPFNSNLTKYSNITQQQQLKSTKIQEQQQLQDSLNVKNNLKVVQSEKQLIQNNQERFSQHQDNHIIYSEQYGRNKSQNKKIIEDNLYEQLQTQHQNIRDQFSFKPELQQNFTQLVESKSQRGISPNRQQIEKQQQQQPIQIKLDIKQFMNSNKTQQRSISPLQRQQINVIRDNGRGLLVNLNFNN